MSLVIERISHATFETSDLGAMVDYYVNVIGLTLSDRKASCAYLSTPSGLPAVTLVQGEHARCTGLAFQIDSRTEIADVEKMLRADFGLASYRRSDECPGVGELLSFADVNGTTISIFSSISQIRQDPTPKDIAIVKLGHIAFATTNLQGSVRFYEQVLGFKVSDWREDFFVWLRCGPDHHTTNFIRSDTIKMHHFAFELKDASEILRACDVLGRKKYKIIYGPGRHVIGDNIFIYHRNPDGQIVELYTELARIESEALGTFGPRPWHQGNPYKPKIWGPGTPGNLWGPGAPPGFSDG